MDRRKFIVGSACGVVAASVVGSLGFEDATAGDRMEVFPLEHRVRRARADGGTRWTVERGLNCPTAAALGPDGRAYVASTGDHAVCVFDPGGTLEAVWGGFGGEPGRLRGPRGVAVGPDGRVYVSDTLNHRVQVFDDGARVLAEGFNGPRALAFGPDGRLYVVDAGNRRVRVLEAGGEAVADLAWPESMAVPPKRLWFEAGRAVWA